LEKDPDHEGLVERYPHKVEEDGSEMRSIDVIEVVETPGPHDFQ
jgi:hypothetical protein